MTLEEFTILRRDELVAFFMARFGKQWRRAVTRQTGMNPRAFDRWWRVPPLSLYRQINRMDKWARTMGFESPTDDQVQQRLQEYKSFQKAAARAVKDAQQKRIEREAPAQKLDGHELAARIAAGMQRLREASPENA